MLQTWGHPALLCSLWNEVYVRDMYLCVARLDGLLQLGDLGASIAQRFGVLTRGTGGGLGHQHTLLQWGGGTRGGWWAVHSNLGQAGSSV